MSALMDHDAISSMEVLNAEEARTEIVEELNLGIPWKELFIFIFCTFIEAAEDDMPFPTPYLGVIITSEVLRERFNDAEVLIYYHGEKYIQYYLIMIL